MSDLLLPSRRDFIKSTSAVIGAGTLLNTALRNGAYAAGNDTVRVGLVGAGGRGSGAASQALRTEGSVKLIAVADAFPDSLEGGLNSIRRGLGDAAARVGHDPADRLRRIALPVSRERKEAGENESEKGSAHSGVLRSQNPGAIRP